MRDNLTIIQGDCRTALRDMPSESVNCCVTSPPYWGLRDYGHADQIGQEKTPQEFVETMRQVFSEVRRVLRKDGTCWLNLGDSYSTGSSGQNFLDPKGERPGGGRLKEAGGYGHTGRKKIPGLKSKDLIGIPWRVALALQADGWWLRSDIIWAKPNSMPESVTDRPTRSHEYLFLLTKSERYHYDHEAIKEPMAGGDGLRNKRDVWTMPTASYSDAHFATYPPDLIKPCILAGCPVGGTVLDPFGGSGTTGMVALELGRKAILIELNPEYAKLAEGRCFVTPGLAI